MSKNDLISQMSIPQAVVIVTSTKASQRFWSERLAHIPKLLVLVEDEPLGNGLGTLRAYADARSLGPFESLFIYHTAGKGTRLAPLPGCSANDKARVLLPGLINGQPITLLEAVIRQTSLFDAPNRLHVFWGDQLFIPDQISQPTTPISILTKETKPTPSYGAIYPNPNGGAHLAEKIDLSSQFSTTPHTSLGSFSITFDLADKLLDEFSSDTKPLNADFDFWMALTLSEELYTQLGGNPLHQARLKQLGDHTLLSPRPVGKDAYWWDYGQLKRYYKNCLKVVEDSDEGATMRAFFGEPPQIEGLNNSVAINVQAKRIEAENSVLINCSAPSITAKNALVYSTQSDQPISLNAHEVLAGPHLKADLRRNSAEDWERRLPGNPCSWEELYRLNQKINR